VGCGRARWALGPFPGVTMSAWPLGASGGAGGAVAASFRAPRARRGRTWNMEDGLGCRPAAGVASRPGRGGARAGGVPRHHTYARAAAAGAEPRAGTLLAAWEWTCPRCYPRVACRLVATCLLQRPGRSVLPGRLAETESNRGRHARFSKQ